MNTELMDYLYGEMTAEESASFEKRLQQDPELKKEFEELSETRQVIQFGNVVTEPTTPVQLQIRKRQLHPIVSNLLAIAASLGLLLLAGSWSKVNIQKSQGQFTISFGDRTTTHLGTTVNQVPVAQIEARMNGLRDDMELLISEKLNRLPQPSQQEPIQPVLSNFRNELTTSQRQWTKNLFDQYQQNQDRNVERLVNELLHYWDSQRQVDLQKVNRGFDQIIQSIEARPDLYDELLMNAKTENY